MGVKFDYTVETEKDFDTAVAAVEEKVMEKGFRVLYVHDVKALLAERGFDIDRAVEDHRDLQLQIRLQFPV